MKRGFAVTPPALVLAFSAAVMLGCGSGSEKRTVAATAASAATKCAQLERQVTEELEADGGVDESSSFPLGECRTVRGPVTDPGLEALVGEVRDCLSDAGIEARGGAAPRAPGDDDAPDGELLAPGPTFIAFYSTVRRAEELADELRTRATELGGTTTRHGRITVLYVEVPGTGAGGEPDDRIEECVEGVDPAA